MIRETKWLTGCDNNNTEDLVQDMEENPPSSDDEIQPGRRLFDKLQSKSSRKNDSTFQSFKEISQKLNVKKLSNENLADSDGYDTDLEEGDETSSYWQEQKEKYIASCSRLKVVPVTSFLENMRKYCLRLSHHGLNPKGIRALALSLKTNTYVQELDISYNTLGIEGTKAISKMMKENLYITSLDLSHVGMEFEGLQEIMEVLGISKTIKVLNISGNNLKDKHSTCISSAVGDNGYLTKFILSHNEFCTTGGQQLGLMLENNQKLDHLDLGWNHLRRQGATALASALKVNSTLRFLNLKWNGFANDGATEIGKSIETNNTLEEIDLSYNRITGQGAVGLAAALRVNQSLKVLNLSWNSLGLDGISEMIDALQKNCKSKLEVLCLKGIEIDNEIKAKIEKLRTTRPNLSIETGVVTSGGPQKNDLEKLRRQLIQIILDYLSNNRLRMLDLFNRWDKDKSLSLTRAEFRKGVKDCKMPFTEAQLLLLLQWLDENGDDEIEYTEFVSLTQIE